MASNILRWLFLGPSSTVWFQCSWKWALDQSHIPFLPELAHYVHLHVVRSPLPGVCNSVVFIQSSSCHDNDQVTSANSSKAVLGRVLKLITHFSGIELSGAIFTQAFSLKWVMNFRDYFIAVCWNNSVVIVAATALYKNNRVGNGFLMFCPTNDIH